MNTYEVTLTLASGTVASTQVQSDLDHEAMVEDILNEVDAEGRPGWRIIGSLVFYTQTVSAIQVEAF